MRSPHPWQTQLGSRRDWIWRGWQVHYTYLRPTAAPSPNPVPILFLHGFGASLSQWRSNLVPFSQHHAVYALDFLGFGASEKAHAPYRVEFWVEQVYDFWRTFIGQPVVIVGHSLGALVALTAAIRHPDMVRGMALMTLPSSRQEMTPPNLQSVQAIAGFFERMFTAPLLIKLFYQLVLRNPKFVRLALNQVYLEAQNVTEDLISSFSTPIQERGAARALSRLVKGWTHPEYSPSAKALLERLHVPTLLLWGDADRVIPLSFGRQLPALNPHLTLLELEGVGHCSYDENSDRVNKEILTWIDTLPSR